MLGIEIIATGRSVPEKLVKNDDMKQFVETSDEWISSRTGIKQRFFAEDETNVTLGTLAAQKAIASAKIPLDQIGACIVTTFTSEYAMPSTACLIQKELGLANDVLAFDLNAACTGFIYGMQVAKGLLTTIEKPYILLIGSEVTSRVLDFTDRNTCVLFGDGAGAVVLKESKAAATYTMSGSDGNKELLTCPGVGVENQYITMQGQDVFRFAIDIIPTSINNVLEQASLVLADIDFIVCHQANIRIIEYVSKRLKAKKDQFYTNVQRYGNTSAGSIPIALDEMAEAGLLKKGMKIICVGFGAGLTWGATLFTW